MIQASQTSSRERVAIVQWTARIGAVTAEALADRLDTTVASARARLLGAERERTRPSYPDGPPGPRP
jgi:hypothetical protein